MTETFTEAEQQEIINEFLTACGEKQEEPEEQEDFKTQYDKLLLTTANHIFQLEQIETINYVPIKHAILKFMEQAQDGRNYLDEPYGNILLNSLGIKTTKVSLVRNTKARNTVCL